VSDRLEALRTAYDADVERRTAADLEFREPLLDDFLDGLAVDATIIELGAGTGQASAHAKERGFDVTALDLSPGNVAECRSRGIDAVVGDFTDPPAIGPFHAAFSFNALLHVPKGGLAAAVAAIGRLLRPGGLFLYTVWGGVDHSGPYEGDWLTPPRFFSFFGDDGFLALDFDGWETIERTIHDDIASGDLHLQRMVLRRV
jgi:SAM-dependent methyltransferase